MARAGGIWDSVREKGEGEGGGKEWERAKVDREDNNDNNSPTATTTGSQDATTSAT